MNILADLSVDKLRELRTHITKNDAGRSTDVVKQLCDELSYAIRDRTLNELIKPIVKEWQKKDPSWRKITVAHHVDGRSDIK